MLSNPLEVCPNVFVYGTLKYGHGNWSWALNDEEYIGPRTTVDKFIMGDTGFPFCFPKGVFDEQWNIPDELYKPVLGDLFCVSDLTTMTRLDRLESEGSMYHRKLTTLTDGTEAWMYQCMRPSFIYNLDKCDITDKGEWVWNP